MRDKRILGSARGPGMCQQESPSKMGLEMPGRRVAVVDGDGLVGGNDDL